MRPLRPMLASPRRQVVFYFLLTFFISWFGAFLLVAPRIFAGQPIPKFTGLMMFPVMLLGPSFSGIFLTGRFDGRAGLRDFFSRLAPSRISPILLPALLIPPLLVLAVLILLKTFVSREYTPNHFFVGAGFGLVAGFFEELGWTGFAFPKMVASRKGWFPSAILLGVLWSCWHIPVIDYLGAATPHGRAWPPFFLAFAAAMTAIRVLICWLYTRTQSILLAQLLHAFSTASLVVLSPSGVSPIQESFWYALYASALWLLLFLLIQFGAISTRVSSQPQQV
ncbi:MAG TPA: CPBP family intramembrane glutamic endopeptidase [Candidatus Acidoferrum sp.]|nr:CPBP family intramembrane glutamic endopeptidase [Candidatus Acidoferrum sp.]